MSENEGENVTGSDEATDATGDGEGEAEPDEATNTAADLAERVEETANEELAEEVDGLHERATVAEERAEAHTEEIDDLESQLKRKQADFQNYKKRTQRQRDEHEERATEDLVERLLEVRDNLSRALSQEESADIRPGVESTLEEFDRVLGEENVAAIEPEPGTEVDPQRHEVMLRVDSDQPTDTVAEVYRPGYEMGEKVLRPAQITVSE